MKKFSTPIIVCLAIVLMLPIISCRKKHDPQPASVGWTYSGTGDGNINETTDVVISYPIQSNLNVKGTAELGTNTVVKNDLNLNSSGKVIIKTTEITDTVYVNGNINVNDTLIIEKGILKVNHDFNINSLGVVNCLKDGQIIIIGSLNQAGTLWGNKYVVADPKNINKPNQTHEDSLE